MLHGETWQGEMGLEGDPVYPLVRYGQSWHKGGAGDKGHGGQMQRSSCVCVPGLAGVEH